MTRDAPLLRLVELARRELDGDDARLELGGREPRDPRLVWVVLEDAWRLVVSFDEPPADRELRQGRLQALVEAFIGARAVGAAERPSVVPASAEENLAEELRILVERAGAVAAAVIDGSSPVVWGSSLPLAPDEDVRHLLDVMSLAEALAERSLTLPPLLSQPPEAALQQLLRAGLTERSLLDTLRRCRAIAPRASQAAWEDFVQLCQAVGGVRRAALRSPHEAATLELEERGVLSRAFCGGYHAVLALRGNYSALHAQAALLHALPALERLVLSLPPRDPQGGARILRLPATLRQL